MSFFDASGFEQTERRQEFELKQAIKTARNFKLTYAEKSLLGAEGKNLNSAINHQARIAWGNVIFDELETLIETGAASEPFFFTLTHPIGVECFGGRRRDLDEIKKNLRRGLTGVPGISFIANIEPALYANVPRELRCCDRKNLLVWHAHGVAWGLSAEEMRRLFRQLNSNKAYQSFVPGRTGAKCRISKNLGRDLAYVLKSPRASYRLGERSKKAQAGGRGRFKHNKSALRPGERVLLLREMSELFLDELMFASGDGSRLLAQVKRINRCFRR
jgi:hypothetical protein